MWFGHRKRPTFTSKKSSYYFILRKIIQKIQKQALYIFIFGPKALAHNSITNLHFFSWKKNFCEYYLGRVINSGRPIKNQEIPRHSIILHLDLNFPNKLFYHPGLMLCEHSSSQSYAWLDCRQHLCQHICWIICCGYLLNEEQFIFKDNSNKVQYDSQYALIFHERLDS